MEQVPLGPGHCPLSPYPFSRSEPIVPGLRVLPASEPILCRKKKKIPGYPGKLGNDQGLPKDDSVLNPLALAAGFSWGGGGLCKQTPAYPGEELSPPFSRD